MIWGNNAAANHQWTASTVANPIVGGAWPITWDNHNRSLPGVAAQQADPNSTLRRFGDIGRAVRDNPGLIRGTFANVSTSNGAVMSFTRTYSGRTYFIAHNLSGDSIPNSAWRGGTGSGGTRIGWCSANAQPGGNLPPYASIIIRL